MVRLSLQDKLSSKVAIPVCIPQAAQESSCGSTSTPACAAVSVLDLGHFNSIPKAFFRQDVAGQFLSICVSELSPELAWTSSQLRILSP